MLSTPRLWSSFEVEIQGSGTSGSLHDNRLMHRMNLWLERSSCCPLSVRLVYKPVGRISDDESTNFLVALVPEARRWRNAHFTLPAASIAKLQPFPPNSFPTLRSLTLKVVATAVRSDQRLNILAMNIPWRQLTDLDLQLEPGNLPTLYDALNILSKTVNLKRAILQLECTWGRRNNQWGKLSLPTLDTLQLILQGASATVDRPQTGLVQFLNLLCLPKLRVLDLAWSVNSNVGLWSLVHTDFLAFLLASADTLRELKMVYFPIAEIELLECLSQVPRLTHLDLRFALTEGANDPITNQFLMACILPSTVSAGIASGRQPGTNAQALLLPRLEHVNLQCHGAFYANVTLLTFIRSRWEFSKSERSLGYFRLLSMKPVSSEMEKHIKTWHEEGLEIDIQCLVVR